MIAANVDRRITSVSGGEPANMERMAPIGMDIVCSASTPGGLEDAALNALNKEILMRLHEQGIAVAILYNTE